MSTHKQEREPDYEPWYLGLSEVEIEAQKQIEWAEEYWQTHCKDCGADQTAECCTPACPQGCSPQCPRCGEPVEMEPVEDF